MRNILLGSALAIGLLGCGSSQTSSQSAASAPPPPATQPAGGQAPMCPMMKMAGANIVASDTADGVAIAFTTTGDPAELRAHARKMADMHNQMAGMHGGGSAGAHGGGMHGGGMHGGGMHGGGMHMVPSRASVEDLPDGARVVLVPSDPSQLSALRTHVREHAAMMAKGECPMMGPKQQSAPAPGGEHTQHHPPGA